MELLGGRTPAEFLREYWQKKPLLIRQALPGYTCPLDESELAGLACEPLVESRLVFENEDGSPWQVHHGPFTEDRLRELPDRGWTLLVQGLDHWVPAIAELLEHFRFIPNWRLDDIMASFAPDGGSVGPHYDHYDVFLLQVEGRRHWEIGDYCDDSTPRLEGTPLRILKDFQPTENWTLEPGDMLYLPPGIAHWGRAQGSCMTLSIGFRAPTYDDVITAYSDYVAALPGMQHHLEDPDLVPQANPGLIGDAPLDDLDRLIRESLLDRRHLAIWFGQYSTEPKHEGIVQPAEEPLPAERLGTLLEQGAALVWNEGSRFAYHDREEETLLFVDGEHYILRGEARGLAPVLCAGRQPELDALGGLLEDPAILELLARLRNQGSLYELC